MICNIPVSIGELYDKYSILSIKEDRIQNESQLQHVIEEKRHLEKVMKTTYIIPNVLFEQLKSCNEELWQIEDEIRKKEDAKLFDKSFIDLARKVYKLNDKRATLKQEINILSGSKIMEVKSYEKY